MYANDAYVHQNTYQLAFFTAAGLGTFEVCCGLLAVGRSGNTERLVLNRHRLLDKGMACTAMVLKHGRLFPCTGHIGDVIRLILA